MFIEPTITWVPSGFSGYIWLDTQIVLKKANNLDLSQIVTLFGVNYILGPKICVILSCTLIKNGVILTGAIQHCL